MAGFLYAMLAAFLAGLGARDQMLLAALKAQLGDRLSLLLVAGATAIGATALAAWGAQEMLYAVPSRGRLMLAALALALGGGEALLLRPRPAPREPTRSLVAMAIVFLAGQITDSARFLVFALALATMVPIPAAIGGAAGSVAALVAGWIAAEHLGPLARKLRPAAGVLLLMTAAWAALRALS